MSYYPWPKEAFEMYVKAMPQSEAQCALIFFMNFVSELLTAQAACKCQQKTTPDLSPLAQEMLKRQEEELAASDDMQLIPLDNPPQEAS